MDLPLAGLKSKRTQSLITMSASGVGIVLDLQI
jgi:hypothetical protein